jgi:hypothetical protein
MPLATSYTVSGAGTAVTNSDYPVAGNTGEADYFESINGHAVLWWFGEFQCWLIAPDLGSYLDGYYMSGAGGAYAGSPTDIPSTGWGPCGDIPGDAPYPTVTPTGTGSGGSTGVRRGLVLGRFV